MKAQPVLAVVLAIEVAVFTAVGTNFLSPANAAEIVRASAYRYDHGEYSSSSWGGSTERI